MRGSFKQIVTTNVDCRASNFSRCRNAQIVVLVNLKWVLGIFVQSSFINLILEGFVDKFALVTKGN
jgi:hypothetical protein